MKALDPETLAAVMERVDRAIRQAKARLDLLPWPPDSWTEMQCAAYDRGAGSLGALRSLRRSLARMARNGSGR